MVISALSIILGLRLHVPHPGMVLLLQVCISSFMSNLELRESLSEDTYLPWDRTQRPPPKWGVGEGLWGCSKLLAGSQLCRAE